MSDVATLQWNKEYRNSGYMTRTYDSFKQGLSRSAQKVVGFFASMTRAAGGAYSIGYKRLGEKLAVSKSSVSRAAETLDVDFARQRNANACTTYVFTGERAEKINRHIHTDYFLYTEIFDGEIKKKGKYVQIERTLNDCEVDVYSLILTHTNGRNGGFDGNPRSIAGILNMNYFTAARAVNMLIAFGLIFRPKKGVNGRRKNSRYVANMKLYRMLKRKHKAPAQAQEEADRERRAYYQSQEVQRDSKAERYKKSVYEQVPRFRELMEGYNRIGGKIEITSAGVEIGHASSETLQALLTQKKALHVEIKAMAARMKIELERFKPEYYGARQCEKCQGTGELPDGGKCDCWLRVQT